MLICDSLFASRRAAMRPRKPEKNGSSDLFRARLDQIINMRHELVRLAGAIDWDWLDGELADRFSDSGRPGTETRFMVGLLLLKHIYALSDEGVCERWVYDPLNRPGFAGGSNS
jgi:transposase, IS5 family